MDVKDVKEEVKKTLEGEGGETSTPEKPKEESSTEVKSEETKVEETKVEETKPKDPPASEPKEEETAIAKQQQQIDNLNIALKKERESKKQDTAKQQELEKKLDESQVTINKLREVFVPPTEETPEDPQYLTKDDVEKIWTEKEERRQFKEKETQRAEQMSSEVKKLEEKWDGKDGKIKYDDQKVIDWQRENEKLYLSPEEAFSVMYKNDLVNYEVKQRLAGKKPVETVEKPTASPETHEPGETVPETEDDVRKAALEAMENADTEL